MNPITLVVPAAGLGSRFRNVGVETAKPLIPILGKPMLEWVIGNFPLIQGDTLVIVGQKSDNLKNKLNLSYFEEYLKIVFVDIDYLTEGPASTVALTFDFIPMENPIVIANSDQFVSASMNDFVNSVRNREQDGLILTMAASGNKWSYIRNDNSGNVLEVREKVEISNEATVGIYAWSSASLCKEAIDAQFYAGERVNNEFYIAPTYNSLIERGLRIRALNIGSHGFDVHGLGTPEDLADFLANDKLPKFESEILKNLSFENKR
jgi:dTDP-glucose pyrophosphorylase